MIDKMLEESSDVIIPENERGLLLLVTLRYICLLLFGLAEIICLER